MVPFKKVQPTDDYAADNSEEMSHEDEDNDSNDDDDEAVEGNPMEEESDSEDAEGMEEEESSDEDEGEEEKRAAANSLQINPVASATGESCTFDLRNLLAMNVHQVSSATLYSASNKAKKTASDENITIAPSGLGVFVNEDYILEKATDGCAQLLGALWQLPMTRSDAGPMAFLPSYDEIKIPRALPPPPPKRETKWEKFAKEKGIPLNKEKRSQKVFDEESGEWKFRHGYQKANEHKEWPIMEVHPNDDPHADPWEKDREAKRTRVAKNTESRMRNEERAGTMSKGTTTRVLKSQERTRLAGKAGGNADRDLTNIPTGVPVDLRAARGDEKLSTSHRGKTSINAALAATQRSTASLGKFDKMREGEPERKKAGVTGLKKRKLETSTDKKVIAQEGERGMKVLNSVIHGGGVAKEKARKKGQLAKGETAYDYDYDDGLGPSSFKKKKGRAGAGKMKKMTKKRTK